jgi:hypothetical protein
MLVTGFDMVSQGTAISITITGVKNPNTPLTSNFKVETRSSANNKIDEHLTIAGVSLSGDIPVPGKLELKKVILEPDNLHANSFITFNVDSVHPVRAGGVLEFVFPSDAILRQDIGWSITGGVT